MGIFPPHNRIYCEDESSQVCGKLTYIFNFFISLGLNINVCPLVRDKCMFWTGK